MEYAVSREGTTLVTLHEGTDTTACDAATDDLAGRLESLDGGGELADWSIADAEVYEHPAAPFDPYTIAVGFSVTVTVDADDTDAAEATGANAIEDALERADVDAVSYSAEPVASPA